MFIPLTDESPTNLPEKFTFPFYYHPHPVAMLAVSELQKRLVEADFHHDFGIDNTIRAGAIGKMFGVLVVQKPSGEIGYLAAFSGKLGNSNHHAGFVPPVYDLLDEKGFFRKEEAEVNDLTIELQGLENDPEYRILLKEVVQCQLSFNDWVSKEKQSLKWAKKIRQEKRDAFDQDNQSAYLRLIEELKHESIHHQLAFKRAQQIKQVELEKILGKLAIKEKEIQDLKEKRAVMSASIQNRIFQSYTFLNPALEQKSLLDIFKDTPFKTPPAGAGECAAPKLLQYAFLNQLKPIAMAEFWWGMSPDSEIKVHREYYPACRGKCEPILSHMLKGIEMDVNPMSINPAEGKDLPILYEDDYLLVVNKPAEFLSVPGKTIVDSVQTRIHQKYPGATGPLLVHRLDMSTSGIILIAKKKDIHESLQKQFLKRTVEKRYVALLQGYVKSTQGEIQLPLRVDLEDRPRQLVCYEHGKHALTKFEVIERTKGHTRVYFYPHTGRTHQLRVHAAHASGLNAPIIGDDLYGQKADRLCLHAAFLSFWHPITKERMEISCPAPF
jgi:tRNA pseudouridine32 synthase / 23S rRNA pseudouridine746 synthase